MGALGAWADESGVAPLERIAFGSCYKPEKETKIWDEVVKYKPELWIWLGDNFYNDWAAGKYLKSNDDPQCFEKGYAKLKESEAMKALSSLPADRMMATWDDHDYGKNDAGKDYARKEESRKAFVKFWKSTDQADGVYSSRDFGPLGKVVRVILLDTRYNRDPLPPKGSINEAGDMLGEGQWKWLEKEFSRPGADLVLLGSSIQFVSDQHPYEKWANFPKSRKRLLDLIAKSGVKGLIFLSGDRHWGEISCLKSSAAGYPLYDMTSSGLTEEVKRPKGTGSKESNPERVGNVCYGHNFGEIRIDWLAKDPLITLEIFGENGEAPPPVSFPLSQLAPQGH